MVNDSNKVASTYVTVEDMNDGANFIVTSGLKPGDRIAVEGVGTTVKEGIVIRPKEVAAEAPAQAAATDSVAASK